MELTDVAGMVAGGESETLEFKKSTAQLPRAAETLRAFLNAGGGTVLIGVTPEGALTGAAGRRLNFAGHRQYTSPFRASRAR